MKKDDLSLRNKDPYYHENVIDYSQDMRVDPLTTQTAIAEELSELQRSKSEAKDKKAAEEAAKSEAEKAEYEAWKKERAQQSDDKHAED